MLKQAVEELNFTAYERFKKFLIRGNEEYLLSEHMDPDTQTLCQEVSSIRYPDAPPRKFRSPTDRCNCDERVAEEDMCLHEIRAKKGYDRSFYLPRHMFRERVSGSLLGWVETKADDIDKIIGYEPEQMSQPNAPDLTGRNVHPGDDMQGVYVAEYAGTVTGSTGGTGIAPALSPALPPTQVFAPQSRRVTPLSKQEMSNIMTATTAAYSRMSTDQKWSVSNLAIQLQEALTVDETQSEIAVSGAGYSVNVPTASALASQPHNRLMSGKEHAYKRAKHSNKSAGGLRNSHLQNVGLSSTVVLGENAIQMNGKSSKVVQCQLCTDNHRYTGNCERRRELKLNSSEHRLSIDDGTVESALRARIEHSMPLTNEHPTAGVFDELSSDAYSNNFILHAAVQEPGSNSLPRYISLLFRVTFLGSDAKPQIGLTQIWVNWTVMNGLLSHRKKKLKFVYDETVRYNPGSIQRGAVVPPMPKLSPTDATANEDELMPDTNMEEQPAPHYV